MNRYPSRTDVATFGISALLIGGGVAVALFGPDVLMPVHYGINGQADRWGGRVEVGLLIAFMGLMTLIVSGLMGLATVRADETRARALRVGQVLALVTLTVVSLLIAGGTLGQVQSIGTMLPMAGISVVFLIVGAFLGRVPPNALMGLRTPWTYKSRLSWDRSNRLAGRLFFIIGLIGVASAAFVPQPFGLISLLVAVMVAALWSVIESWRVWRDDPDRQPF